MFLGTPGLFFMLSVCPKAVFYLPQITGNEQFLALSSALFRSVIMSDTEFLMLCYRKEPLCGLQVFSFECWAWACAVLCWHWSESLTQQWEYTSSYVTLHSSGQDAVYPRLALNQLCSQGWLWTPNPPALYSVIRLLEMSFWSPKSSISFHFHSKN